MSGVYRVFCVLVSILFGLSQTVSAAPDPFSGTFYGVSKIAAYQEVGGKDSGNISKEYESESIVAQFDGAGTVNASSSYTGFDFSLMGQSIFTYSATEPAVAAYSLLPNSIVRINAGDELIDYWLSQSNNYLLLGGTYAGPDDSGNYDSETYMDLMVKAGSSMSNASLVGTFNGIRYRTAFHEIADANGTYFTDSIEISKDSVEFDGSGNCSITSDISEYIIGPAGIDVVPPFNEPEACTYAVSSDGMVSIYGPLHDPIGNVFDSETFWLSVDGNVLVHSSAETESSPDLTHMEYATNLLVAVKAGTAMNAASLAGTYKVAELDAAFEQVGEGYNNNIGGETFTVSFDGAGGCNITDTAYQSFGVSTANPTLVHIFSGTEDESCGYTVSPSGLVTITTPTGSGQLWASANAEVLVGGQAGAEGSYYDTEMMVAVKLAAAAPPAVTAALVSDDPTPSPVGTPILFTASASGGTGSYEYKFWIQPPGGSWTMARDYSTTATWSWTTTGLAAGDYGVAIHVRNAGTTVAYDAVATTSYTLTSLSLPTAATLTPDVTSPRVVGTQVLFTAGATGGTGSYEYKFWVQPSGGAWTMVRDYSATPTWSWSTTGLAAGTYTVAVHVRNAGSSAPYEQVQTTSYTLTALPVPTAATLTPDVTSPRVVGTQVLFTAGATGGTGSYEYKFWVQPSGGAWTMVRDYSATPTWSWSTTGLAAGTHTVAVHVRNAGSSAPYEQVQTTSYTLTALAASLRPASVAFAGSTNDNDATYEYKFWVQSPGGAWTMARDYSQTSTWTWTTTGIPAGLYTIAIHVRKVGSVADYETYSMQTLNLP